MAHFQKDGLWVQGGLGALAAVSEQTPFVPGQLGRVMSIRSTDGKVPRFYQYVKNSTATAAATTGAVAYWADYDDFKVTPDSADAIGGTTAPVVAGVYLSAAPADGYYGFVQVGGPATLLVADTNTLLGGELLVASGTQFATVGAVVTNETTNPGLATYGLRRVGQALAAAASATTATVVAMLDCVRIGW